MPPPFSPVKIVTNAPVWGELRAGILVDQTGKQYRFVTYEDPLPERWTSIEYEVLDLESDLIWVHQIIKQ